MLAVGPPTDPPIRTLCMAFVDNEKACDTVERSAVMKALRRQGVEKIVKISENIYKESSATIQLHTVSEKILIQKRIRHSDTIYLKLFTSILEEVFKNLGWKEVEIQKNFILFYFFLH